MCINCGHISPTPDRPSDLAMMCSVECGEQWEALYDHFPEEALNEIGSFTARWPDVTTMEFLRIVEVSQDMDAKYPGAWPFQIEYHEGRGCWHYARKGAESFH
jgi:hypothetical protein